MISFFEALFWASVCIYFEARGEPVDGKVGVGQVIMNRALKRGISVREVIRQDKQFSWYNGHREPPIRNYRAFINSMRAAGVTMIKRMSGDNLHGANHYYNPAKVSPSWAPGMHFVIEIGRHRFLRSKY